jgi:hypothetical protein
MLTFAGGDFMFQRPLREDWQSINDIARRGSQRSVRLRVRGIL